ncbi:MAG: DUF308 domain-containing protein, partial [Lachnospiraceae bacterium]|nr:DUF308 domain-containing protein [Lachnospiraceae bacterium]
MKDIIVKFFKKDGQVYAFLIIGIVLILFPDMMTAVAPYVIGIALIVYGTVNIFVSLKFPDSDADMGDAIVKVIIGIIILAQNDKSITTLGIIWAMQSFTEVAEEIEEYRKERKFHVSKLIFIIISIILAAMLIMDPFDHFTFHVVVLGLEMIA